MSIEDKSWGFKLFEIVNDVAKGFNSLGSRNVEFVYLIASEILSSDFERFLVITDNSTGRTAKIYATFLFDDFRDYLTVTANERIAVNIHKQALHLPC